MRFFFYLGFTFLLNACWSPLSRKPVISVNHRHLTTTEYSQRLITKVSEYDSIEIKDPVRIQKIKKELTAEIIEELLVENWAQIPIASAPLSELERPLRFLQLKQKLFTSLAEKIPVRDEDIELYYQKHKDRFASEKIHLRQVFVKSKEDAQQLLHLIRSQKMPFYEVARKYSLSAEAQRGGDMGWLEKGSSAVIDAAFKLPRGVSSQIFESPQGFHLFEVIEVKKTPVPPMKEVREQIIRAIKEDGLNTAYQRWLEEQTQTSKIVVDASLLESLNPAYQESL